MATPEIEIVSEQAEYLELYIGDKRYGYSASHSTIVKFRQMLRHGARFKALNWLKDHCSSWFSIGEDHGNSHTS